MDDRIKGGGGGEIELCSPEHQHSINGFWQVLPFGESKGPCGAEKQKDKSVLHFEVKATANQKQTCRGFSARVDIFSS